MLKSKKVLTIITLVVSLLIISSAYAADYGLWRYKVTQTPAQIIGINEDNSTTIKSDVTEHGICKVVHNGTNRGDVFIPTKTSQEWERLYTTNNSIRPLALPSGLTLTSCTNGCQQPAYAFGHSPTLSDYIPGYQAARANAIGKALSNNNVGGGAGEAYIGVRYDINHNAWNGPTKANALLVVDDLQDPNNNLYWGGAGDEVRSGTMTKNGQAFSWNTEAVFEGSNEIGYQWYASVLITPSCT